MAAVDTNVLVRFIIGDDASQLALVDRLIAQSTALAEALFVPKSVVLEMEWVLRSSYGVTKEEFLNAISTLLSSWELVFEDEAAIEEALDVYQRVSADFADCLHVVSASRNGERPFWTFDRQAATLSDARRLTAAGLQKN